MALRMRVSSFIAVRVAPPDVRPKNACDRQRSRRSEPFAGRHPETVGKPARCSRDYVRVVLVKNLLGAPSLRPALSISSPGPPIPTPVDWQPHHASGAYPSLHLERLL